MVANNNKAPRKGKVSNPHADQDNKAAIKAAHLDQMEVYGADRKRGSGAKENALKLWQSDLLDGVAELHEIDDYVNRYAKGNESTTQSRGTFRSAMLKMGNAAVIKVWPAVSATLDKLIAAKDKGVSRKETDKDKWSQQYAIAGKIAEDAAKGTVPVITDEYIRTAVAKPVKSDADQAKSYRQSILDSTVGLLPEKPTAEQLTAAREFFKAFTIELPAQLKPVEAPAKAPAKAKAKK